MDGSIGKSMGWFLSKTRYPHRKQGASLGAKPQPSFNKQFDLLVAHLNDNHKKGWTNYLCCSSEQQVDFMIFFKRWKTIHYQTLVCPLFEGFEDPKAQIAVFTDHQLFNRYHKYRLKSQKLSRMH